MKPRTSVIGLALLAILALLSWAQTPSAKGVLSAAGAHECAQAARIPKLDE